MTAMTAGSALFLCAEPLRPKRAAIQQPNLNIENPNLKPRSLLEGNEMRSNYVLQTQTVYQTHENPAVLRYNVYPLEGGPGKVGCPPVCTNNESDQPGK